MRRFLKKRYILGLIVLLAIGFWWKSRTKTTVEVKTATVQRKDLVSTLVVSGKVDAERKASLTFGSAGKLAFVRAFAGQPVTAGEWLAGLDLGDLQATERAARYNYLAADANAKYIEDTVKNKDSTESFLEKSTRVSAQTTRDKAYDAWLVAQKAVRDATLKSPIAGVVTSSTVSVAGDTVGVTDGMTVVDPASLYFDVAVNEDDITRVYVHQDVTIVLDAFKDVKIPATVSRVGYATKIGDTGATVLPIWVTFSCDSVGQVCSQLKVGLNGDAELKLGEAKGALVLPIEAVKDGEVQMKDGTKKKVTTGLESDFEVQITSGLQEGDVVVVQ